MAKTYRVSVHSALMEAERELVHKELEIESLRAAVQRLTDCVGLLPPAMAEQFWFNWNTHPGLSARSVEGRSLSWLEYPWRWAILAELFWRIEHWPTPLRHWGYRQRKAFEHHGARNPSMGYRQCAPRDHRRCSGMNGWPTCHGYTMRLEDNEAFIAAIDRQMGEVFAPLTAARAAQNTESKP